MAKFCTIDGCSKLLVARSMCGMHYRRWRLYGDPKLFKEPKPPAPPEPRFWAKVTKCGTDECWEWQGLRDRNGYGRFWLDEKQRGAHRVVWVFENGPVPEGMCVLHRCDNPPCVNPAHLFLGTTADNNADRAAKDRSARTHSMPVRPLRFCSVPGCRQRHLARGFCAEHYREWRSTRNDVVRCSIPYCSAPFVARGLCHKHYKRWQTHGDPLIASKSQARAA